MLRSAVVSGTGQAANGKSGSVFGGVVVELPLSLSRSLYMSLSCSLAQHQIIAATGIVPKTFDV